MIANGGAGAADRAASGIAGFLRALPADVLARSAREFAARTASEGLSVHRDGRDVPIPPALSPVVVPAALLADMSRTTRQLASGLASMTRHVLAGGGGPARDKLFGGLGPLELACLDQLRRGELRLATCRVDYFLEGAGDALRPRALELNATIPAMQGYSDVVAAEAVRALGALRGLTSARIEELALRASNNTRQLLDALVALGGGADQVRSIAIVSRRGDSQLGELGRYVREWTKAGVRTVHVYPDEVTLASDGAALCRGERVDVIYRHVFARRVDPASDFAKVLLAPEPHRLFNPVCTPLEIKGMLALLAEACDDGARAVAAGIPEEAIDRVRRFVPWTRPLVPGPAVLDDGSRVPDLVSWVRGERDRVVLKKSWDYGGHGVFLGRDCGPGGPSLERIAAAVGRTGAGWNELVDHALADADLWIAQMLVEPSPRCLLLAPPGGSQGAAPVWEELYVDISAYATLGESGEGRYGGACRAAPGRIVNIQGGGGVAPLLTEEVAEALAGAG